MLVLLLAGCASGRPRTPGDPLEPANRAIYRFNETADKYVTKPVAKFYDRAVPQFARTGIRNFFNNLAEVAVLANDLLQLKFTAASRDGVRIVANTVFGGFGLVDVAGMRGLRRRDEDFGQTLGYWGAGPGPFVMLPFLGPSTVRDGVGLYVDTYADLLWRIPNVHARNSAAILRIVDKRASLLPTERIFRQAAVDPYSFLRDAYLQRRISQIYDGNPPMDLEDEEEFEDPGEGSADDPLPDGQ